MSTELERDITEIKVAVARVEEKFKQLENYLVMFVKYEERLRELETWKSKTTGYAIALGSIAGGIVSFIFKLL